MRRASSIPHACVFLSDAPLVPLIGSSVRPSRALPLLELSRCIRGPLNFSQGGYRAIVGSICKGASTALLDVADRQVLESYGIKLPFIQVWL
jgi:hypothetical protein